MMIICGKEIDLASLPSLEELGVTPELLEAAEEICDGSDVLGLEKSRLELLLRVLLSHPALAFPCFPDHHKGTPS